MAAAQGINKVVSWKRQTALGTPASGAGGSKYRRRTAVFNKAIETFKNDEIVDHGQSTGVSVGGQKPTGKIDGLLSPGAYSDQLSALLRRDFTAVTALTAVSVTIAVSGSLWTVTRAAGDFLAGGFKVGHVFRLTVGTLNAANISKNLLIVSMTATVLTVKPLNGVALVAEGPVTGTTITVVGKVTYAPIATPTAIYYTYEDYYPDISPTASETWPNTMIAKADLTVQASGNSSISLDLVAQQRVRGTAQVLTSPAAAPGNDVVTGAFGVVICNGVAVANITGFSLSIDGQTAHSDLVLGATFTDDMQRGVVEVSGQFTSKFDGVTLQAVFDAGSVINIIVGLAEDATGTADFIVFTLPAIKLTGDAPDDGPKQIIRTYPFTAQYNPTGGAGTSSDQSILSLQDSAAA